MSHWRSDSPIDRGEPEQLFLHHRNRKRDFELAAADPESAGMISAHIERHIGPVAKVISTAISDLVAVHIHVVEPDANRPLYTLVTSGMSDRPMDAPDDCPEQRYSELMLCLPSFWLLDEERLDEMEHAWPLRLLIYMCRFPHKCRTWLWVRHTMTNGYPPRPFASDTELSGAMLLMPSTSPDGFDRLRIHGEKIIHFHGVIPLHVDELELAWKMGVESLFDGFERYSICEVLLADRPSICD